jgi:hypothetical protein
MRRFVDRTGKPWDIVAGRESWGAVVALFVPVGDGAIRQAVLNAINADRAMVEIDELDELAVQALFERSTDKEET